MEFVSRKTSGFWNRQYAISIEIRIAHLQKEFQAPVSEICSVLMRNIYVSWKSKHFVSDYGKKVLKSWTFPPSLPRNLIDKYMFHSSLIPSPILREIWVEWASSSPSLICCLIPTHTPFRELRKISSCITYSTLCAAINVFNMTYLL